MKTLLALIAIGTMVSVNCPGAGVDAIIKQHARDLATQNNNRYSAPAPAPAVPAPPTAAPTVPTLAPSLVNFDSELASLSAGTPANAVQQKKLAQDLLEGAQGAKPSGATATNLVQHLTEAFAQKPLSSANRSIFVRELDAVLNPGKYPQARLEGIFGSIERMFRLNGANDAQASQIVEQVKAMSSQIQQGGAKP
jgi:hypothetical protein